MSTTIYRADDPTLGSVEYGAVYRIRAPRTGDPWNLYNVSGTCGVSSIDPLDIPVDGEETDFDSCALLYRFIWAY